MGRFFLNSNRNVKHWDSNDINLTIKIVYFQKTYSCSCSYQSLFYRYILKLCFLWGVFWQGLNSKTLEKRWGFNGWIKEILWLACNKVKQTNVVNPTTVPWVRQLSKARQFSIVLTWRDGAAVVPMQTHTVE